MIEETISLKDLVTGPAQEMLEGVTMLQEGFLKLAESAGEGGGGMMGMVSGMSDLAGGVGLVAGPLLELGEKIGDVGLEMGELALESVEAKDKLLATFSALAGGPEAGKATLGMLNDLSDALPQSRDQLGQWTKQYQAMGVTNLDALRGQLTATASAQALMGDAGASAYTTLTKKVQESILAHQGLKMADKQLASLAATGVNVDDVAKKMGMSALDLRNKLKAGTVDAAKFGDALQASLAEKGKGALDVMGSSLSTMKVKFMENIGRMFEDIDISPFTDALKDLGSIFGQNTASGQAMKGGLTSAFSAIFKVAGKVVTFLRHFFLDLVIWGLKGYIALKPMIKAAVEMNQRFGIMGKVVTYLKTAFMVVAGAIGVVIVAAAALVAAVVGIGVGMMALVGTIEQFVGQAFDALTGWAKSGMQMAGDFIDGLISGITGGVGKAVDAVKNLGTSVLNGVKGVLGIHSPSIELMKVGMHTAGGMAMGITAGANDVGSAAQTMAQTANDNAISPSAYSNMGGAPGAAGATGGAGAPGGGKSSITFMPGSIVISGAGKDVETLTEEAVSLIFERIKLAQGL